MRFTPPRRARRRMAGFVMPWMLSRSTCGQRGESVSRQRERGRGERARGGEGLRVAETGGGTRLAVALGAALAEALAALAASGHGVERW